MPSSAPLDLQLRPIDDGGGAHAPALDRFVGLWRRLEAMARAEDGDGPAPPRRLLDVSAMRDFLDLVMLVDVAEAGGPENGVDFRFRVYGTGLAQLYGADLTGWRLSAASSAAADLHRRCFEGTLAAGAPLLFRHTLDDRSYAERVEGMCFPLSLSGRRIDQLVALEAPLDLKRPPTPYL